MVSFREFVNNEELYHGSSSEEIDGPLRTNERDAGWFGAGFYLSAYPSYAKRWGPHVYKMKANATKFAVVNVSDNYNKMEFVGEAEEANQYAGGQDVSITHPTMWSSKFTEYLKNKGYDGVAVNMDGWENVEVVIFDPSKIQVLEKVEAELA